MGSAIYALVESFDNNAEKEKLANDSLNSLIDLAKLQIAAFSLAIRDIHPYMHINTQMSSIPI
jgi:hypothetical protein